ncbi:MAG: hypothetical protein LBE18_00285 [Planctomycetaceae bacterium]|jgi:tetratricopeptide (TPR) repeat protein|nr:hypothetical protein [Planctomycetaceae bacterium]
MTKLNMTNLQTEKFNELHLFIDESGDFLSDKKNRLKIVGGVILFGKYTQEIQNGIKDALLKSLKIINGKYPQDLHFHNFFAKNLPEGKKNNGKRFVQSLIQQLMNWQNQFGVEIYGIKIHYDQDVFYNGNDLLAERELDNRYLQMLWSLVEHIIFVNSKVTKRLKDDAVIHLHVAERSFVFDANSGIESVAKFYGWQVSPHKKDMTKKVVYSVIHKNELQGMFRMALRNRWQKSQRRLGSINIRKLLYQEDGESTPALYLADILLGVELLKKSKPALRSLLNILANLTYDASLESLAICKSQLDTNGRNSLLSVIAEHPIKPTGGEIMDQLITLFQQNKEPFYKLYETALQYVNHPHYRNKGLQLQWLLDTVHEKSGQNDLQMFLHTLQINMAYHDHTGNTELGDEDWETYRQFEPQLVTLGSEKAMEFYTDFRCKRAVNLMDMFRYDEAGQVLIAAGQKEEEFAKNTAAMFGCQVKDLPKERIGWVYSSLGQVFAFQGNRKRAEEMFRNALQCFDKKNDIEREWVYLGHLACDFPNDLQSLLSEVFEHLPQNTNPFEEPFILALKLKTVYVCDDAEQQKQWADDILTFVKNNEETLPFEHPWGMIYQMAAMLFDKIGDTEHAQFMFHKALWSFNKGEGVLKELGKYCQLRSKNELLPKKIRFNYW